MNANLLLAKECYAVVGAAMEVLNTLGHGLLEKPYENALAVELSLRQIPFEQQPHFPVLYKGVEVGEYIPDIVTHQQIIVEAKAVKVITDIERAQVINYLRISNLKLGILLNFRNPTLQWERIVLSKENN